MATIGIDVSKAKLDIALLDEQGKLTCQKQIANAKAPLRGLLFRWRKAGRCNASTLVCLEPTGHYSYGVVATLLELAQPTWLAHATDIRFSIGMQRSKSDQVDAHRIAQYAHRFRDKARLLDATYLRFRDLCTLLSTRDRVVRERAKNRTQLRDNVKYMSDNIKCIVHQELFALLEAQSLMIANLEKSIDQLLNSEEQLAETNKLAQTVTGIGPVVASTLIAFSWGFTRFNTPRQMVCYAGKAPFEHTSGSSIRGRTRVSSMANRRLKSLLRLSAQNAVRSKGDLQDYYLRKVAEGKKPAVVLNAVAAKLIHHVWAVVHSGKAYRPHLQAA